MIIIALIIGKPKCIFIQIQIYCLTIFGCLKPVVDKDYIQIYNTLEKEDVL